MASEYLKWKYRDVKPDAPIQYTKREKRKNWWAYHKWHVVIAAVLALIAWDILYDALGVGQATPDYQIAYVGSGPLPDDTAAALERAVAALGQDCSGDGRVTVRLNQYVTSGGGSSNAEYAAASAVTLMGDLSEHESYFFLLDDPDRFQQEYGVLRRLDGTLPADGDRDYAGCYLAWDDCPVLRGLPLGTYTTKLLGEEASGDSQELLSELYIARRGFWTEQTTDFEQGCDALWAALTEGAVS